MTRVFSYTVEGTGGNGQTWTTSGTVQSTNESVDQVMHRCMYSSFEQLTSGKAVYGKPGIGCQGPYDIHRILIEQVKQ